VVAAYRKGGRLQCSPEGEVTRRDDGSRKTAVLEHLGLDTGAAARVAELVSSECGEIPRLYADAPETLHYFKENGFSTGIFSSRPARQVGEILSTHELSGLLDVVVSLNRSAAHPDRSPFAEALEDCGIQAKGLVRVGINLLESCREPGATDVDSIVLDRHLAHILDDRACKIRSLGELRYLVKHRGLKG
jgi:FMN phosphatase YigB (HAD superfamily)